MSYAEVRDFLAKYTQLIELADSGGARVAVAPQYQGRVMTSSCDGPEGMSFGFVNRDFITAGIPNEHFNNYGGEERMWISPEGGQFSLWFKPGVKKQTLADWFTPPELNDGPWPVVSQKDDTSVRMAAKMKLQNTSGTRFDMEVARNVRLLSAGDCRELFGQSAAKTISQSGVKMVAYETDQSNNQPRSGHEQGKGADLDLDAGHVQCGSENRGACALQIRRSVATRPGGPERLFRQNPARAAENPARGGPVPRRRPVPLEDRNLAAPRRDMVGSIDYLAEVLTLVKFSMPAIPADNLYMSNLWGGPLDQPYVGDVMNSYNDGPPEPGKKGMGAFYELESLSPAKELKTGESISHKNVTVHIQADMDILARSAKEILGVDLEKVRKEMHFNKMRNYE